MKTYRLININIYLLQLVKGIALGDSSITYLDYTFQLHMKIKKRITSKAQKKELYQPVYN